MSEPQEAGYDVVILGAGSGGYACALRASQLGLRVALVDAAELGGTCLHRGCIPTKALLHAAEVADEARQAARVGVQTTFDGVDGPGLLAYQQSVVDRLYQGLQGLVAAAGVDWLPGRGHLVAADTVAVRGEQGTQLVRGRHVVIATGSQVRTLDGVALGARIVSSDQALRLERVPTRALVLGGGVIGVEFASIWSSLGAQVTIVEALDSLLPAEDPAISKGLVRALKKRGISVRTGARVASAHEDDDAAHLVLEDGTTLDGDLLLVAVGRGPVTADLGLAEAGVELDEAGFVRTDERLQTTAPGVYAVGDVVRGLQLAHRGFRHGIVVAERIAGLDPAPVPEENIPRVTYCDPQVASVGLTEPAAREQFGDEIDTVEQSLAGNGKSQILGTSGMVKMVRRRGGPIVGVHLLGARMGEQIGEAQMLVNWEAYPQDVAPLVHAHPTQNESLGEAALALAGTPLHSHN